MTLLGAELARPHLDVVSRRLLASADLSEHDLALLARTTSLRTSFPARAELIREDRELRPLFLVDGWACRQRVLPDGRRQIVSIYLPGDLIGSVLARPRPRAPCTFLALTPVTTVEGASLRTALADAPERHEKLIQACAGAETALTEYLVNHIVRLGRQTSLERMAHFFLETDERLRQAGLVEDGAFTMPLTQEVLADMLGISHVHINRTLQALRREGLVAMRGSAVILRDIDGLKMIADYRPLDHG